MSDLLLTLEHMFDTGDTAEAGIRCVVIGMGDPDVPALTDEQIAELIAGDSYDPLVDDPDLVTGAHVLDVDAPLDRARTIITAGQHQPIDDVLAGQLTDLDPDTLAEDLQIGLAVALTRVANH